MTMNDGETKLSGVSIHTLLSFGRLAFLSLLQGFCCYQPIIEVDTAVSKNLVSLMALAAYIHDIAVHGAIDSHTDGLAAVCYKGIPALAIATKYSE